MVPVEVDVITIIEASRTNLYPIAHVTNGTIIHTSWGITRWHALGRAAKWAKVNYPDEQVRVGRWVTLS